MKYSSLSSFKNGVFTYQNNNTYLNLNYLDNR